MPHLRGIENNYAYGKYFIGGKFVEFGTAKIIQKIESTKYI